MEGVTKAFPGVQALKDGRLELLSGEVHALLGENGAGKSTLLKVLSGAHQPDGGQLLLGGQSIRIASPADARARGIAVIYQELNLVGHLTVRENLFLGRERTRMGLADRRGEHAEAKALLERLATNLDPETEVGTLTVAQQQMVEIARALSQNARIVVMDEPTAALSGREVDALFAVIADLKASGVGIVYVSHRLDEIFQICDRATVMRDGAWISTRPISEWSRESLIEAMVGRSQEQEFPHRAEPLPAEAPVRLEAKNLVSGTAVRSVSLTIRRGEILGLTGLVGAGRTEVARLLFGADRADSGEILLDGKRLRLRSPQDAVDAGICLLTEDRKRQGLVLDLPLRDNFGLPNLPRLCKLGFIDTAQERTAFGGYIEQLSVKTPGQEQLARNLSGGNQQKVVLAKWLFADAEVILFDEPTRGIDVGAKYEIYVLMRELAARGKAILMISSELPEVLGMADRILVMRDGQITGEIIDVKNATQAQVLSLSVQ
jgi:ABC-type sugar transport system ATPase subunit